MSQSSKRKARRKARARVRAALHNAAKREAAQADGARVVVAPLTLHEEGVREAKRSVAGWRGVSRYGSAVRYDANGEAYFDAPRCVSSIDRPRVRTVARAGMVDGELTVCVRNRRAPVPYGQRSAPMAAPEPAPSAAVEHFFSMVDADLRRIEEARAAASASRL